MKRRKRCIVKWSVFLGIFLIVCTIISGKIYLLLLPQVRVFQAESGALTFTEIYFASAFGEQEETQNPVVYMSVAPAEAKSLLSDSVVLECNFDDLAVGEGIVMENRNASAHIIAASYNAGTGAYDITIQMETEPIRMDCVSVMITASTRTEEYGTLLPIACVFSDAGGTYVMAVQERAGAAGKNTRVERYAVNVLESNDQYAAVGGYLPRDGLFAAYPSRALEDGEIVQVIA